MMLRVALVTGLLLLVPLVAMQFTDEVRWNLADFVVAGALLFGAGATYQLLAARTDNLAYRAAVGVAVGATLMLVWANLAVGLIGSEDNPANLMYLGVLAVGIIGALVARFDARDGACIVRDGAGSGTGCAGGARPAVKRTAGDRGRQRALRRAVRRVGISVPTGFHTVRRPTRRRTQGAIKVTTPDEFPG